MNTICYSDYDPFARVYNETWGPELTDQVLRPLETVLLPYLPPNARILDLCCGTGQVAQQLQTQGYRITGLDSSKTMLEYARINAPEIEWIVSDARHFIVSPTFNAVISTSAALNHVIDLKDLMQVFKNVYIALLENGLFVFNLYLGDEYQSDWHGSMSGNIQEEYAWAVRRCYQPDDCIGQLQITVFELIQGNWQRSDTTWFVRGYSKTEICSALEQVGFRDVSVYDAVQDFDVHQGAGNAYFVCRK
jgi:SAM-dependent methyltransferase